MTAVASLGWGPAASWARIFRLDEVDPDVLVLRAIHLCAPLWSLW
jgi:hypothetical protein